MLTDADGNEIGKVFVGGLSQATNDESLRQYFLQLGEVEDCVVMMDSKTGRSRGFGYVKYRLPDSVTLVLRTRPHCIDGKEVDVKQCNVNMKGKNRRSLKIFVGGISLEHDADSIRSFFEQYGRVTDVNLMMDQAKNRHRGFAFVGFEEESVVKQLIGMHYVSINSRQVELKAMEPPNFAKKVVPPLPPAVGSISILEGGGGVGSNSISSTETSSVYGEGNSSSLCCGLTGGGMWRPGLQYHPPLVWPPPQQWVWPPPPCEHAYWPQPSPAATGLGWVPPTATTGTSWYPPVWPSHQPQQQQLKPPSTEKPPDTTEYWLYKEPPPGMILQLAPDSGVPGSGEGDYSRSATAPISTDGAIYPPYYATRN